MRPIANQPDTDAEVAVVGLGPVGATVAALLARQGVATIVLEREPGPSSLPRAVALDDEALRILQASGLSSSGGPDLLIGPGIALRGCAERLLLDLPPPPRRFGHPTLAFVHQPDLEIALRRRLANEPLVQLRLGSEVTGMMQHAGGVTLHVAGADPVRVAYALGCDGASGVTRRTLGVPLRGWSSPRRWLVIDGRRAAPSTVPAPFTFHADPRRPRVDGPLPGGRHRWEFMLTENEDSRTMATSERASELLHQAGAGADVGIERAAVYTFHARVAARWRRERVLLLGDAAHLSPPFAGQGLGAGLRDADNLSWKLAAVLRGEAREALLDSYAAERRTHVRRMNALALGLGGAVQARSPALTRSRDALVAGLARVPGVAAWAHSGGWKPPPRHRRRHCVVAPRRGHPADGLCGCLMPQPLVRAADGRVALLDDILGAGFALVGVDAAVGTRRPSGTPALEALCLRPAGTRPGDHEAVVLDNALDAWWPRVAGRVLVVRPDRYVFAVVEPDEVQTALRLLTQAISASSDRRSPRRWAADGHGELP